MSHSLGLCSADDVKIDSSQWPDNCGDTIMWKVIVLILDFSLSCLATIHTSCGILHHSWLNPRKYPGLSAGNTQAFMVRSGELMNQTLFLPLTWILCRNGIICFATLPILVSVLMDVKHNRSKQNMRESRMACISVGGNSPVEEYTDSNAVDIFQNSVVWKGCFKNTYELINLGPHKFSLINKLHLF